MKEQEIELEKTKQSTSISANKTIRILQQRSFDRILSQSADSSKKSEIEAKKQLKSMQAKYAKLLLMKAQDKEFLQTDSATEKTSDQTIVYLLKNSELRK